MEQPIGRPAFEVRHSLFWITESACKKTPQISHILPRVGNLRLISLSKLGRIFYNSLALLKDSDPSPACPSDKITMKTKLGMEHWWNDTGNGKSKNVNRNVSLRHLVHQKSHMNVPRLKSVFLDLSLKSVQLVAPSQQTSASPLQKPVDAVYE
jgi:hypothetical protein